MPTILSHGDSRARDTGPGTESPPLSRFHRVRFAEARRAARAAGAPGEISALDRVPLYADSHARRDPGVASETRRMPGRDRLPSVES